MKKNRTFITVDDWEKEYTPSNLKIDEFSMFDDDLETLALLLADRALSQANDKIYFNK